MKIKLSSFSVVYRGSPLDGEVLANKLAFNGEVDAPDLLRYNEEECGIFVEVAFVARQVESYTEQVAALKEVRKAGGIVPPQVLQNLEDSLKSYERLHLSLKMRVHDIELKHRHDPK